MRRAFRRVATSQGRRQQSRTQTFPAPVRGWVANENLAASKKAGAKRLENWFPTTTGIRVFGGSSKRATITSGDPVISMWTYKSGATEEFFAADETNIFDLTVVADADTVPAAEVTGQTSGYYATTQIGTAGGDYLYACNGTDDALLYDGTAYYPVSGTALHELDYDAETGAFTAGLTLTGGTSGATATIVKVIDAGTTGTLWVNGITGTFQDNETLTDSSTGSATANGASALLAGAITGVDTDTFSHVWNFASRLFFVEKGTMNAWYLGVDSITGAATKFSLAGIFQAGGELLFGASWSLDSGDGLDDKCVFVSSQGEVAIYEGTNPGDAAAWSKVGVYRITSPMGMKAIMSAGGDLLIATEDGIVPLSEAIRKDPAALSLAAVSRAIEPEWKREVSARRGTRWEIIKWASNNMMVVSQPVTADGQQAQCLVANLETGAWCKRTGWDTRCMTVFNNFGYFGTNAGTIHQMDVGGNDDGEPYSWIYVGLFDHLKAPGVTKVIHSARTTLLAGSAANLGVSVAVNYQDTIPSPPNSIDDYPSEGWDEGEWDVAEWDAAGTSLSVITKWHQVGRSGFAIAPVVQGTSGVTPKPSIELVAVDLLYELGGVVV